MNEEALREILRVVAKRHGNTTPEPVIYRALRALPEETRLKLLIEMYTVSPYDALRFVQHSPVLPESTERFLRDGIMWADASNIKHFLTATVPRMGWNRTFAVFESMLQTAPLGVIKCDYWLMRYAPHWFPKDISKVRSDMNRLRQDPRYGEEARRHQERPKP